jgi:hypothetical protein
MMAATSYWAVSGAAASAWPVGGWSVVDIVTSVPR